MTAAPLLPQIRIDERASIADTRAFLERDRLMAAYALADLDPESGDRARWWLARREGEAVACVLLVEMLPFRPCFATGDSEGLSESFREGIKEARSMVAAPDPARLASQGAYWFARPSRWQRT